MKMALKGLLMMMAVFCCGLFADSEKVSMVVGSQKSIQAPFVIESFKLIPAKTDVVKVEVAESILRVQGNKVGEVSLVISGGGIQKEYVITVKTNLTRTLQKLRNDLDALTELTIDINEDQIQISGNVTDPEHWALFQRVLPNYSGRIINYATFKPSADTIKNLKLMLTEAGFAVVETGVPAVGQLSLTISSNVVVLNGELYSQASVDKVNQILATQPWLSVNAPVDSTSGRIQGIVNLKVVETLLEVDVVYVGLNESEGKKLGSADVPVFSSAFGIIYDMVAGRAGNKTAQIGGNMEATTRFLAQNGISRTYNAGHVSFANNDPNGGTLHTGGTVYAKVSGIENGSLQNIEYGLKIQVKGGLVSPSKVKLELKLNNSSLMSESSDSYTLSEDSTSQTVYCDLDKTLIVAGSKKIAQDTSKSGLPVLRNTPVLKWFVSEDGTSGNTSSLLILVCPRLVKYNEDAQIDIPISETTAPTLNNATQDTQQQMTKKKKKGFLGWFSW